MLKQAIRPSDLSFILQGPVSRCDRDLFSETIKDIRRLAPSSEIIVSTWPECATNVDEQVDHLVSSVDPGGLHSIRADGQELNNVNRQIVTTQAGLRCATRPYSVKMRTDARLINLKFVSLFELFSVGKYERIVIPQFFTLDPRLFEQVPYHLSDWFHFGATDVLRELWSAPHMTPEDATYYSHSPYRPHSTYLDRKFYCRLATEQHIMTHFAKRLGYETPLYHNDNRAEVLADHDRFLAERFIVAPLGDLGLKLLKYEWVTKSSFQKLNCLNFLDWRTLVSDGDIPPLTERQLGQIRARRRQKTRAKLLYHIARPLWPIMYNKIAKATINRVLRAIIAR